MEARTDISAEPAPNENKQNGILVFASIGTGISGFVVLSLALLTLWFILPLLGVLGVGPDLSRVSTDGYMWLFLSTTVICPAVLGLGAVAIGALVLRRRAAKTSNSGAGAIAGISVGL